VVAGLKGTKWDTGLDLAKLIDIKAYFEEIKEKYQGIMDPISEKTDTRVLVYQVPGGMLSNLVSQLKEQNAIDRFDEVLEEMPCVRQDLGYPPLVTPTSQIVGTQAVLNVLLGERYKVIPKEVKEYVSGMYGRPPAQINKEIMVKVLGDEQPITCRPADLLEPELARLEADARELGLVRKEEDVLTYALYPQVAPKFLRGGAVEEELTPAVQDAVPAGARPVYNKFKVVVDGEVFQVEVEPTGEMVIQENKPVPLPSVKGGIKSSMQGMVLGLKVKPGDTVQEGDVVAVIEAMKMENNIHSTHSGIVREIFVKESDFVAAGNMVVS
jgi:pyruvate carboxylase subunit B